MLIIGHLLAGLKHVWKYSLSQEKAYGQDYDDVIRLYNHPWTLPGESASRRHTKGRYGSVPRGLGTYAVYWSEANTVGDFLLFDLGLIKS